MDAKKNAKEQDFRKYIVNRDGKNNLIGPAQYGNLYYCIKTDLSQDNEIYVYADLVEINNHGDLILYKCNEIAKNVFINYINLVIPAGKWDCFFAASCIDGSAVAVEHWKG
ncbi:MAG: hypothetical protein ACYCT7_10050 [bacterium]